jgi:hypothetical protein
VENEEDLQSKEYCLSHISSEPGQIFISQEEACIISPISCLLQLLWT